jgi:hypothetical protein
MVAITLKYSMPLSVIGCDGPQRRPSMRAPGSPWARHHH